MLGARVVCPSLRVGRARVGDVERLGGFGFELLSREIEEALSSDAWEYWSGEEAKKGEREMRC